jgi:hypothetical protein
LFFIFFCVRADAGTVEGREGEGEGEGREGEGEGKEGEGRGGRERGGEGGASARTRVFYAM